MTVREYSYFKLSLTNSLFELKPSSCWTYILLRRGVHAAWHLLPSRQLAIFQYIVEKRAHMRTHISETLPTNEETFNSVRSLLHKQHWPHVNTVATKWASQFANYLYKRLECAISGVTRLRSSEFGDLFFVVRIVYWRRRSIAIRVWLFCIEVVSIKIVNYRFFGRLMI